MTENSRYVKVAIKSGYLKNIISIINTLVFLPLIIAKIGMDGFGIVALLTTISTLAVFFDFGVSKSSAYFIAKKDYQGIKACYKFTYSYVILAFLLSLFLYLIFKDNVQLGYDDFTISPGILVFCVIVLLSNIILSFLRGVLEGEKRIHDVNIGFILNSIMMFPGLYLLILFNQDSIFISAWITLGYILLIILHAIQCKGVLFGLNKVKPNYTVFFQYSKNIFLTNLLTSGFLPLVRLVVSILSTSIGTLALFDIAVRFATLSNSFISVISTPYFALFSSSGKFKDNWVSAWIVTKKTFVLYLVGVLAFYLIGEYILNFMNIDPATAFYPSLFMIAGLCITGVIECIYRFNLAYQIFSSIRFSKFSAYPAFLIVFYVLNINYVDMESINIVAISFFISSIFSSLVLIVYSLRAFKEKELDFVDY